MNRIYKYYFTSLSTRPLRIAFPVISIIILVFSVCYFTWHSSLFFSNIQDSIAYKYLFSNFRLNDIVLPGNHSNILKFPLFFIEAALPHTFKIYLMVNLSLVAAGVIGWAILLIYIFGRHYIALICLCLASILLISPAMSMNFTETTIRNIEYPIGLSLLLAIRYVLNNSKIKRKSIILISFISILFGITLAGDSFMLYSFLGGITLALIAYCVQSRSIQKRIIYSFGIILATYIISTLIRKIVTTTGVVKLYFAPQFNANILPFEQIGANVSTTIHQLIGLSGSDIFGKSINVNHGLEYINLALFSVSIIGGALLAIRAFKMFHSRKIVNYKDSFLYLSLCLIAFTTVLAYVVSGYAAYQQPNGVITSLGQERYITLVPFILVALLVATIKTYYTRYLAVTLPIIILIGMLFSLPTIIDYSAKIDKNAAYTHRIIDNVITAVKANGVKTIISGDTIGSVVRFWSHDTIDYASVIDCNHQFTHNIRRSWYLPNNKGRSALVVDRSGIDAPYWKDCTDEKLRSLYGNPMLILPVENPPGLEPVYLWIYPSDIRDRIIKS
jgi:hypothetical protein